MEQEATPESTFAAAMAADEQHYAALMAQAKSSLARIKEIEVGFGKVREAHDAREDEQAVRARELLSRIEAEVSGRGMADEMEIARDEAGEDQVMEGGDDPMNQDPGVENTEMDMAAEDGVLSTGRYRPEDSDFPELMERAKQLLARITMGGESPAAPKANEAQAAKQMWSEEESDAFWNSM